MYQNLISLIQKFNKEVAAPQELPLISVYSITAGGISSKVRIPCRVKHVMESTYGKFPKETASDQIVMEYKHFFKQVSNFIPTAASSLESNEEFK